VENIRKYGRPPFNVAVIHGGPGAPGEVAPIARELCKLAGILEPLQTAKSIEGQIEELKLILEKHAIQPLTLIGFSWGAWLSFIFACRYNSYVAKLIMVGSGPFEESYASKIMETRMDRLDESERKEAISSFETLNNSSIKNKNKSMERLGKLLFKADSYDPLPYPNDVIEYHTETYQRVWKEAAELRKNGRLLEYGSKMECPVIAIHGDYDPHPPDGVKKPLSDIVKDFRFIELENCGHYPWLEKQARETFYDAIKQELSIQGKVVG
jgi:pimeloyl-ACP methyl ester carboxylesterase